MTHAARIGLALTALLALASGCPAEEEPLEHGIVKVMLVPAETTDAGVFGPTVTIKITMYYDTCLTAYYSGNPDATITGRDGEKVFGGEDLDGEGWKDRLCEVDTGRTIACTVESFEQEIGDMSSFLTVTYGNLKSSELANRIVPFGPLPLEDTAMCEGGALPLVRLSANGNVSGRDGDDDIVWQAASFTPMEAVTNQGGEITVRAAPPI